MRVWVNLGSSGRRYVKRIQQSDSESEESALEAVDESQITIKIVASVADAASGYGEQQVKSLAEAKRVSVAWLCFDRERSYKKPGCNSEFKLNPTTSTKEFRKTHVFNGS